MFRWFLLVMLTVMSPCLLMAAENGHSPVAWVELGPISVEHGLSLRNTGDGSNDPAVLGGSKCRVNDFSGESPSFFFYFDYDENIAKVVRPVYVTVEYFDEGFGTFKIQYDSVDRNGPERGAYKNGALELLLDSREWRSFTFELNDARFDGRQSYGADFRLITSGKLAIRRVTVEMGSSEAFARQNQSRQERVFKSAGRLSPSGEVQVTFSGIEAASSSDFSDVIEGMKLLAPVLKILGATSVETYVRWSLVEQRQGICDWSYYDRLFSVLRENGLKWSPCIVAGPSYATPDWFRLSKDSVYAKCLEHGAESHVQSIWNPGLSAWVDRFIAQFSLHYGVDKDIESILIGISGDFGEAIYPVTNGGWISVMSDSYHTHAGYWCGDDYARVDFRRAMTVQYGSVDALNAAWGSHYSSMDDVSPFVPDSSHSDRSRLDLVRWYRGRMTNWADTWLGITRKYFPTTPLYLCTGGDGQPSHGSDFSAQCKTVSNYRAGVRITNGASDYALDFACTRLVSAACRHYGAYCSFESMGDVTVPGIVSRIYSTATSKTKGVHVFYPAILSQPGGIAAWGSSYKWLRSGGSRPKTAVLYPQTSLALNWGGFYKKVMMLRDAFDFDLVDESMIRDAALKHYKVLLIPDCTVLERDDAMRIMAWVRSGGMAIACDSSRFTTVDGDSSIFNDMFDASTNISPSVREYGAGLTVFVAEGWSQDHNPVVAITHALGSLSIRALSNLVPDGVVDGIFVSDLSGHLFVLNANDKPAEKQLQVGIAKHQTINLPANAITLVQ